MNKEIKISLAILIIGLGLIAIYWFMPDRFQTNQKKAAVKEIIILPQNTPDVYQDIPEVQSYLNDIRAIMKKGQAVLPLQSNELDDGAQKAQEILLKDQAFLKDTKQGEKLLHNDMMRILPAIISALDKKTQKICQSNTCYQAEKYNFVDNATTRAIVDIDNAKVVSIQYFYNMQPDISLRLTNIAKAIALHAPEVKKELGTTPSKKDMAMANVRGSLQESPCENSAHLCVAPTFADYDKEKALWAVVDLTELKLAAAKWSGLGKTTTPACISERSLQNRHIMENYCQKNTVLEQNGWKFSYRLTGSDGLEVIDASFLGRSVLSSAKIVDWHVSYQQQGEKPEDTNPDTYIADRRIEYVRGDDGNYFFGYNDAMGCPMFSTSVVLPFNAPQVKRLKSDDGFMLTQDYRNPKWPMACNYRYENRFEFYDDGSFRVVGVNKGRGCGSNALYRPVIRIDMAVAEKEALFSFDGKSEAWQQWKHEQSEFVKQSVFQPKPVTQPIPSYKITAQADQTQGYYIEPNHGQFGDNSRGDNATLFASLFNEIEGAQDLLTLGSCCNLNEDGVEAYVNDKQSIDGANIVLWYVPRVHADARAGQEYCWADTVMGTSGNLEVKVWPCTVGPKFIPINLGMGIE